MENTAASASNTLLSVSVVRTGTAWVVVPLVYEVPLGTSVRALAGGGVGAVVVGGVGEHNSCTSDLCVVLVPGWCMCVLCVYVSEVHHQHHHNQHQNITPTLHPHPHYTHTHTTPTPHAPLFPQKHGDKLMTNRSSDLLVKGKLIHHACTTQNTMAYKVKGPCLETESCLICCNSCV